MSKPRLIFRNLKGYKYDVKFSISYTLPELSHIVFENDYLELRDGVLDIKEGYAWDGASGPTWDDMSNYRSSLVHDALYQVMREVDILHPELVRKYADELLRDMSIEDAKLMFTKYKLVHKIWMVNINLRYKIWFAAVRLLAKRSSTPKQKPRGKLVEIK